MSAIDYWDLFVTLLTTDRSRFLQETAQYADVAPIVEQLAKEMEGEDGQLVKPSLAKLEELVTACELKVYLEKAM
jgi:hypothetical protein